VFTDLSTPTDSIRLWNWTLGDGSTSTVQNPVKRYTQPGKYNVQLTVISKAGCVSNPFDKQVIVYLQPVIDAGPSFVVQQGTFITFNAKANDSSVLSFSWTPAIDFINPNVLRASLVANRDETYKLVATGQGDCSAEDFVTVKIFKPVKVPNAFTPNNDGINDKWVLDNLADYQGATVEIYNRYGQMVYRTTSAQAWDGTFKGTPLPVATYYYIIDLKNGFAPLKGSVTIIR
jgi:gliding motility-associated-like protein